MKLLVFLFPCLLSSWFLYGQNFVGTIVENKNIVLEEFTGINCAYCPKGHKIAQQIYDDNTNDVVLINIHVGYFATPNTGEPDYKTSFGSAINN